MTARKKRPVSWEARARRVEGQEVSREIAQRILHRWPAWDESIIEARSRLADYNPAWRAQWLTEFAGWPGGPIGDPQAPEGYPYRAWEDEYGSRMRYEAQTVVRDLGLPGSFEEYWIACFLADYGPGRHGAIGKLDERGYIHAVYPPSGGYAEVRWERQPNGRHRLVIAIDEQFATPGTVDEAAEVAKFMIRRSTRALHPLLKARKQVGLHMVEPDPSRDQALTHARRLRRWTSLTDRQIAARVGLSVDTIARNLGTRKAARQTET